MSVTISALQRHRILYGVALDAWTSPAGTPPRGPVQPRPRIRRAAGAATRHTHRAWAGAHRRLAPWAAREVVLHPVASSFQRRRAGSTIYVDVPSMDGDADRPIGAALADALQRRRGGCGSRPTRLANTPLLRNGPRRGGAIGVEATAESAQGGIIVGRGGKTGAVG